MDPSENPYKSPESQTNSRENEQSGSEPAPFQLTEADRKNSAYWLQGAALGLIIISLLELCVTGLMIFFIASEATWEINTRVQNRGSSFEPMMGLVAATVCFLRSIMVLVGATCMRLQKNYRLAQAGAVMSLMGIVFMPLWFGVPFGLWACIALATKKTQAAFAEGT
jgi:hypothetical protein